MDRDIGELTLASTLFSRRIIVVGGGLIGTFIVAIGGVIATQL